MQQEKTEEPTKVEKRKFKIKIRVKADYMPGENNAPDGSPTFDQVVHQWYKEVGEKSLLGYLNAKEGDKPKIFKYYSYVMNFTTGDTVDKETYD